ncbi:MipA/OmpV family protein [Stella sp.]|uniref:MipA/OmpV family protein n=1 Tax=Stella sp. TaxID=2912054 RepID=UPI0035B2E61D
MFRARPLAAIVALATVLVTAAAVPARADTLRPVAAGPVGAGAAADRGDWRFAVGGGVLVRPEYEGAKDYEADFAPVVSVSYREFVQLRGTALSADLLGILGARPVAGLQAGPVVRYRFGRDQDDSAALRGLGDVDGSVEVGGFVRWASGPWSIGATVVQDVAGGHEGMLAELDAGWRTPIAARWTLGISSQLTWADGNYSQTFFGITTGQAARSGRSPYAADGGLKDVGLTVSLDYAVTRNWGLSGRVGYKRLLGDAADSPLVDGDGSPDQFLGGLFVSYRF